MRLLLFMSFSIITMTISCSLKKAPVSFSFDGRIFKLPETVEKVKSSNDFKYFVYRGFRGKTPNYETVLQLENYPIWTNSQNVSEEFYMHNKVIGVTFIRPISSNDSKNELNELEVIHGGKFSEIKAKNYQILELNNGLVIVASEKKEHLYLSFYCGLEKSKISTYVENIW